MTLLEVVKTLAFAALSEEIVFRIIPLTLAMRRWGVARQTLGTLIVSSIIFGLIHEDVRYLLMQGVTGVMLGTLFIKCSDKGRRFIFASIIVVIMHFIFDFSLVTLGHFFCI